MSEKFDPVLAESLNVFLQYGYRKTSLDEVANMTGVSRQTLYKRYGSKEGLFKQTLTYVLESQHQKIQIILAEDRPLIDRLIDCFDILMGQYVDKFSKSDHIDEIMNATKYLIGDILAEKHDKLIGIITAALLKEKNYQSLSKHTPSARDTALTLYMAGKGAMKICQNYEDFSEKMYLAIRVICSQHS